MAPKPRERHMSMKFDLTSHPEAIDAEEFNDGDILEVLDLEGVEGLTSSRGVFWVEAVELRDDSGITLLVACLGADDQASTALLGTLFNRKKARLHLCSSRGGPPSCTVEKMGAHASSFYKFANADYPLKSIDANIAKAFKRRRREVDRKKGKGRREESPGGERVSPEAGAGAAGSVPLPGREGVLRRPKRSREERDEREAEEASLRGVWVQDKGALDEAEAEGDEDLETPGHHLVGDKAAGGGSRPALKEALAKLKTRLGHPPSPKARDGAGAGGDRFDVFKPVRATPKRRLEKERSSTEASSKAKELLDQGEDTSDTTMKVSKKEKEEKRDKLPGGVLGELVSKATMKPKVKKPSSKNSKSKKTAMALMQTLAKGLGLKTMKGLTDSKAKERRKKKHDPDDPGGSDGSHHSGSSPMESSESGSEETSEDEKERTEMAKVTPPLERMSQKKAGSVLKLFVQHMKESLQNLDEGEAEESRSVVGGVSATKYWHLIVKPQLTGRSKEAREIYCLLQAIDQLRAGHLDHLGDLLAARVMAIHQSVADGGSWRAAKHLEIKPLETASASSTNIVLQARRFAKLSDRALGITPRRWQQTGRGGKPWYEEDDGPREAKGRGKGKKGRGKGGKDKSQSKDWRQSQEPPPNKADS